MKKVKYDQQEAAKQLIEHWLAAHKHNDFIHLFEAMMQLASENDIKDFCSELQITGNLHFIKTNGLNEVYELQAFLEKLKVQYGNSEAEQLCLC